MNTYTLYWLDGKRETVQGADPAQAMTLAGYGGGAAKALDFYADGDDHNYTWDAEKRSWAKAPVPLSPDDKTMILAFMEWEKDQPLCSPRRAYIEFGHGDYSFPRHLRGLGRKIDKTGPNTFKRLVSMQPRIIDYNRNGFCWLTTAGRIIAKDLIGRVPATKQ